MDPSAYTKGEQFQRERHALFAGEWLPFGASGQMQAAGDFVSHSIGGWPLFAVRGGDGVARAFHNVCRHQSMPVIEQSAGSCEVLRCRYHGWTYGLKGEFLEAPPRVASADPAGKFGLNPVELVEQDGFCLVRVGAGGEPPPRFPVPAGRFAAAVATDVDANWKAVIEPFLDGMSWRFVWPLAFICQPERGIGAVRQIVPRSFLRTRIIDVIFTGDGVAADDITAAQRRRTALDKAAVERCQAAHAAGNAAKPSNAAAEFLGKVAALCGE